MIEISLPRINVREVDGTPAEGWQLFFYEAGSSTVMKDTFADAALTTPNANPVLSDASGWFPAIILNGSYNVVLRKSVASGSQLVWSQDNITDIKTTINALIAATSVLNESVEIRNQQYTYAVGSGSGNAINLVVTPTPASYVDGMRVQVRGYTGANTVTAPTINVNSLGTRSIVKDADSPLIPGDIAGDTHTIDLIYSSALSKFILQNPRGAHYLPVTAAGTADAMTATVAGFSALYDGMRIGVVAADNITSTTPTLDVNSGGALTIKRATGSALFLSDIVTGKYLDLIYRASDTSWLLINVSAETSSLPIDYLSGLRCTSAADDDHDITTATGSCRDSANLFDIVLGSAITKQLDAAWSEGNNFGGLPTGVTLAGPEWLYYFVIAKDDGTVDAGFDDNASATNLLVDATGYIYFRHIASVYTDASNNIQIVLNNSDIGSGTSQILSGSGNFIAPPNVYLIDVFAKGGGASTSTDGNATTFGGITAPGGQNATGITGGAGGAPAASSGVLSEIILSGAPGSNGRISSSGDSKKGGIGGGSYLAQGGDGGIYFPSTDPSQTTLLPQAGNGYGAGGGGGVGTVSPTGGGGEGGMVFAKIAVTPGQSISYSVGASVAGPSSADGSAGTIIVKF